MNSIAQSSAVLFGQYMYFGMPSDATLRHEMQCHARYCYVVTCTARLNSTLLWTAMLWQAELYHDMR
eukprot:1484280-Pyramimonas_sp.AAC.1